jgi:hypothetical protein
MLASGPSAMRGAALTVVGSVPSTNDCARRTPHADELEPHRRGPISAMRCAKGRCQAREAPATVRWGPLRRRSRPALVTTATLITSPAILAAGRDRAPVLVTAACRSSPPSQPKMTPMPAVTSGIDFSHSTRVRERSELRRGRWFCQPSLAGPTSRSATIACRTCAGRDPP